jgi:hypothetical protein
MDKTGYMRLFPYLYAVKSRNMKRANKRSGYVSYFSCLEMAIWD